MGKDGYVMIKSRFQVFYNKVLFRNTRLLKVAQHDTWTREGPKAIL